MIAPQLAEQLGELKAQQHAMSREQFEAHLTLDSLGVPRVDPYQQTYTLSARMELLRLELESQKLRGLQLQHDYDQLMILFAAAERRRLALEAMLRGASLARRWRAACQRALRARAYFKCAAAGCWLALRRGNRPTEADR